MSEVLTKAIADHGESIRTFRAAVDAKHGELSQRMADLEQAVIKGLKGVTSVGGGHDQLDLQEIVESPAFEEVKAAERGVRFKLRAPRNTVVECVYRGGQVEKLTVTPSSRAGDVVTADGKPIR